MIGPRVITDPLGGSSLSVAVQAAALDASVTPRVPAGVDAWRRQVKSVAGSSAKGWFGVLREAFGPSGVAVARLQRVVDTGGVVVTTGQQAGLFGGPVYTWSKAIGALALADAIERETGVAVAPVFWAATDDADYAEASLTHLLINGVVERLKTERAPAPGTPMALAPLGDVRKLLTRLREACGSSAYEAAYAAAADEYRDGVTVGAAYVSLLRALLDPLGIAVLDSSHVAVRAAGGPLMRSALEHARDVGAALNARRDWLRSAGYEPQVADVAGLSTVFVHEAGLKRRVPIAESAAVLHAAKPDALSPNVLLRPVMERAILPTVAYVAGPGELAYFAQVSAVAGGLGAAQPLAVPRWSCTIVEPAVDRALTRLGIGLDDIRDADAVAGRVARGAVPDDVQRALAELRAAIHTGTSILATTDAAASAGRLLRPEIVEGLDRQLGFRLDRLERRLLAAAKRRGSDGLRDLHLARAAIWPDGARQERTLNFIPFLARYGDGLWARMREGADAHAASLLGRSTSGG